MGWLFCYNVEGGYMEELYKIIGKLYKEYQAYLNIKDLEDYVIEIKPAKEMGNVIASTIKKDCIRYLFLHEFLASNLLSSVAEHWEIGVLFHEFTHIADDKILEINHVPQSKKYIYQPYIEYHAEFIKTLYMFDMQPFNNRIKISHTEKINSQFGYISIYDYVVKAKEGYVGDINTNKKNDMQCYISFFDRLSYFLGAASVYRICCDYKLDEIMDISSFTRKLGDVSEKIKDILLNTVDIRFDSRVAIESAKVFSPLIQPFLNK